MPLLNYSTKVPAEKTVSEIQGRLVKNGARQISFDYNGAGLMRAMTFQIAYKGHPVFFSITPNFEGVMEAMRQSGAPKNLCNTEQACRVAWRIEKDWLEAQLAKIEAGLATIVQLLLPYAVGRDGVTFYERMNNDEDVGLLGPGK